MPGMITPLKGARMISAYLDDLWFIMHHSDDPDRQTMIIGSYLDESGTGDLNPQAVVAGLVMDRENYLLFDVAWNSIISKPKYKIESPIHMKEFGKHGRLGHPNYPTRKELFIDLAGIINCYKIHSVAISLGHEQYTKMLSTETRKDISLYGLCFMFCAYQCFAMAHFNQYYGKIAFLIEEGNEHAEDVLRAYRGMIKMRKQGATGISDGSLMFESKKLSPLQAADIIAWGVRRKVSGVPIIKGFEPILKIFDEKHIQNKYSDELLQFIETHSGNKP